MRKIIQVSTVPHRDCPFVITALCDDGTLWTLEPGTSKWDKIAPIPQDEGPEKLPDDLPLCNCFELNKNPSSITQRCKVCAHDMP